MHPHTHTTMMMGVVEVFYMSKGRLLVCRILPLQSAWMSVCVCVCVSERHYLPAMTAIIVEHIKMGAG